jgi:ketosteroid isomerase-like protein
MLGGEEMVFRGHDGFREAFRDLYGALEWIRPEVVEVRDLGDRIVALGTLSVRGKSSGAEAQSPAGWVAEMKGGRAIRFTEYLDPEEALQAAGLSA